MPQLCSTYNQVNTHLDGHPICIRFRGIVEDPQCNHRRQRHILWDAGGHALAGPGPVVLSGVSSRGASQNLHLILLAGVEVSDFKLVNIC